MALLLFLWLVQSKSISIGRHVAFSLSGSTLMLVVQKEKLKAEKRPGAGEGGRKFV